MQQQKSLQLYIRSGAAQESIEATLKNRATDFTTSLLTVVNSNPLLQECDNQDVVRTALKAASMRLPIDPNLGLAYIIPYRNKVKVPEFIEDENGNRVPKMFKGRNGQMIQSKRDEWRYEPQLQIGWKGFIQLALRTRQYQTINVTKVVEGEYGGENYLTGAIQFNWNQDKAARDKMPPVGYVAYFRLHDGFEKILYMTGAELEEHATKYSQSYKQGYGKWKDDKPSMSKKTVIKLLISKWGPQSTELQTAFRADQAAMTEDDNYNYLDNNKGDDTDQTPPAAAEGDDIPEGEVVDPPAPDDTDQTPKEPTEAEAPQTKPATAPKKSVKDMAAERGWTKGGNQTDERVQTEQGSTTQANETADAQA